MLMNNLDPDVAERPDDLVVYGGTGRAARSWDAFDAIVARAAARSADDETLLVQSGKPVGVFRTHEWSPRVLIANSNLVGEWANWDEFRRLEALGLTMYGQMTAGSWIYIGSQGIVQGTYECFAEIARRRFGGIARRDDHAHRRARRHGRRPAAGGDDERRASRSASRSTPSGSSAGWRPATSTSSADDLDDAIDRCIAAKTRAPRARASACARTPPRSCPSCCAAASRPTSSPTRRRPTTRWSATSRPGSRSPRPTSCASAIRTSTSSGRAPRPRRTASRWSASRTPAPRSSTTATASAARPQLGGFERAFDYPGFVPAYIRPLFCEGKGPFRWAALSGDPADIAATDRAVLEEFPDDEALGALDPDGERADRLPGPAGADLLARLRRAPAARAALQRAGREAARSAPRS